MPTETNLHHGPVLGLLGIRVIRGELNRDTGHLRLDHRLGIQWLNGGLRVLWLNCGNLWRWLPSRRVVGGDVNEWGLPMKVAT